jgi:ankyrin repeat protein
MAAVDSSGCADLVTLLLDRGAKINAADTDGFTSLFYAASNGDASTVIILLERGAVRVFDTNSHSRMPFDPTHVCLKLFHAYVNNGTPLGSSLSYQLTL